MACAYCNMMVNVGGMVYGDMFGLWLFISFVLYFVCCLLSVLWYLEHSYRTETFKSVISKSIKVFELLLFKGGVCMSACYVIFVHLIADHFI